MIPLHQKTNRLQFFLSHPLPITPFPSGFSGRWPHGSFKAALVPRYDSFPRARPDLHHNLPELDNRSRLIQKPCPGVIGLNKPDSCFCSVLPNAPKSLDNSIPQSALRTSKAITLPAAQRQALLAATSNALDWSLQRVLLPPMQHHQYKRAILAVVSRYLARDT